MNRAVLLTGRLRHHLHTGIQDLFTGHHQLGMPSTKKFGEQASKMGIYLIEGTLQEISSLRINFGNCVR